MEFLIPYDSTTISNYEKLRNVYAIINNDLTILEKELERFTKPAGDLFEMASLVDQTPAVFNKLFSKYMYHVGQYLKRGINFEVILGSSSANETKNKELRAEIERSIEEKILIMQEQMQITDPEEKEKYYNEMRSHVEPEDINIQSYKSEVETFYADALNYFKYKYDFEDMVELTVKHALISDLCLAGIVEKHGHPEPEVSNPLHIGYFKSPDFISEKKGDYWWKKTAVSVTQALDELKEKLSKEELENLSFHSYTSSTRPNKKWDIRNKAQFSV